LKDAFERVYWRANPVVLPAKRRFIRMFKAHFSAGPTLGLLTAFFFLNCSLPKCIANEDDYWARIPPGPPNSVGELLVQGDMLIAGGLFDEIGGVRATNIARWEGERWSPLGTGLAGPVVALALHGTDLYAAVAFVSERRGNVFRWDGGRWDPCGNGIEWYPRALASIGTNLFLGGLFGSAGAVVATNIARWDGAQWHSLGEGLRVLKPSCIDCNPNNPTLYGQVKTLAVIGDQLFAAGEFNWADGVRATNVARWDGSQWHALGNGLPTQVESLAVFRNELYASGPHWNKDFSKYITIDKWDGTNWAGIAGSDLPSLVLASNGRHLYAGGTFTQIGGIQANRIARWDGQIWSPLGSGLSEPQGLGGYGAVAVAANGSEVYVAGTFTKAGNAAVDGLAVWHIPQTLKATRTEDALAVSWPVPDADFQLEAATNLGSGNWSVVTNTPAVAAGRLTVTNSVSDEKQRFYRLRK
jgi:hypothetical protein